MKSLAYGMIMSMALAATAGAAEDENFQLRTAGDLAQLCASTDEIAAIHMCHGFLVGVDQMHSAIAAATDKAIYCLPEDRTADRNAATAAFVAWAGDHPQAMSEPAHEGLLQWAKTAYPCN